MLLGGQEYLGVEQVLAGLVLPVELVQVGLAQLVQLGLLVGEGRGRGTEHSAALGLSGLQLRGGWRDQVLLVVGEGVQSALLHLIVCCLIGTNV